MDNVIGFCRGCFLLLKWCDRTHIAGHAAVLNSPAEPRVLAKSREKCKRRLNMNARRTQSWHAVWVHSLTCVCSPLPAHGASGADRHECTPLCVPQTQHIYHVCAGLDSCSFGRMQSGDAVEKTSERWLSIDIQKCVFVLDLVQMFCGSSIPNQLLHALNKHEDFNRRTKGKKNNTNFILVGNWVLVFVLHDQNFNYGCQTSSEVPFVTVINCVSISHFKNSDKICILLDKVGWNKRGCWELFFLNTKGGPDRLLRTTGVGGCLNHSLCD